jgi:hypothetical protein
MIYSSYTFHDCYSAVSPLHAYFLPGHGNGEASILGKLPYMYVIQFDVACILLSLMLHVCYPV